MRCGTSCGIRLQLFATDIDEEALAEARNGRYPGEHRRRHQPGSPRPVFRRDNGLYCVNEEVRESVLFSPHNLLRDPPFSRLDLVSCRNLLIYLNREAQDRVLNPAEHPIHHDVACPQRTCALGQQ